MVKRNENHKQYYNEHLRRRQEIRRAHGQERRRLRGALRAERRAFWQRYKLPKYPLMADVFDVAEEARAEPNSRTPFAKETRVLHDVVYKRVNGEDLVMDLYFPSVAPEGKYPVVMDIPGGGWMIHNRPRRDGYAACFAAMGAVVAVIDHRLCPNVFFPDNLADCVDAYNFLVDHAQEYHLDPDDIVVTGDSSGGHLTACLGCAATNPQYVQALGIPALKTKPAGLIFISGAFNFERMYRIPFTNTLIVRYVSGQHSRKAFRQWRYYKECNPQNYIGPDYPACYNNGGATDFLCMGEADYMAGILDKNGVANEVRVGKNLLNSDHCYVLRFPFAPARRDALALYDWYARRQAALGVDVSAGFARVRRFLTRYDEVMAGKIEC